MADLYSNNAGTTVAGGAGGAGTSLGSGDTTLLLASGTGVLFPTTTSTNGFMVLLGNLAGTWELVRCTSRSTDTLTIARAQEGTTATTWVVGTPVQQVVTAAELTTLSTNLAFVQAYNIKAFGAVGDGVTDDTAAIQAAINAAAVSGQLSAPSAPSCTGNTGVGSSFTAGQTVNVQVTFLTPRGETVGSANTLVTIGSNGNNVVVTNPALPSGATSVGVYASISNGSSTLTNVAYAITATTTITNFPSANNNPARTINTTGTGGVIYCPASIYLSRTLTLFPFVHFRGEGIDSTIIRLKSGTNADLFNGGSTNLGFLNVANTTYSNGSAMDIPNWSFHDMTLDGNYSGQASGPSYPLRMYSHGYVLDNVRIRYGYSGGIYVDYNGVDPAPDQIVTFWNNVEVHDCGLTTSGVGIVWGGPTDSAWEQVVCFNTGSHCVYIGPHASDLAMVNCHTWGSGTGNNSASVLCETDHCQFSNCQFESSDTVQVVLLANFLQMDNCHLYNVLATNAMAMQVGQQAGGTPYNMSVYQSAGLATAKLSYGSKLDVHVNDCTSASGAFNLANEFATKILATVIQNSGSVFGSSTPSSEDALQIVTQNMTAGVAGSYGITRVADHFALTTSSTTPAVATNGTISTVGLGITRVTPAAAVTGIILQAGTYDGQEVTVLNQGVGGSNITFAAVATSHVAAGTSVTVNGAQGGRFVWSTASSVWYYCP